MRHSRGSSGSFFQQKSIALAILLSFGFQSDESDTTWNGPITFDRLESVTFRWREVPAYRRDGDRFIEMEFTNTSDTSEHFHYLILSDSNEVKVGSIVLQGGQTQYSAWYFGGTQDFQIDAMRPEEFLVQYREMVLGMTR